MLLCKASVLALCAGTLIVAASTVLGGCNIISKGGDNPTSPTAPPPLTSIGILEVSISTAGAFLNKSFSFNLANTPATGQVIKASVKVSGDRACPELYAASIVAPSGKLYPIWQFDRTLPCPYPSTLPQEYGSADNSGHEIISWTDTFDMPMLIGEPSYGAWGMTGSTRALPSHRTEIRAEVTLVREIIRQ
jgi:hypothetical protein